MMRPVPIRVETMDLHNAINKVNQTHSELSSHNEDLDELVAFGVRRLVNESFDVIAKGLSPSRFEGWSKGARSRVARQFGSSSDLTEEVLRRASVPERGDLASSIATAANVIANGESYETVVRAFAGAFYDNLANDDGFHVQIVSWVAAASRDSLRSELDGLYRSLQERIAFGITTVLESANRQLRDGLTIDDHAAMLLAATEGAVLQGMIRGHEQARERYCDYVSFLIENGSEVIPPTEV